MCSFSFATQKDLDDHYYSREHNLRLDALTYPQPTDLPAGGDYIAFPVDEVNEVDELKRDDETFAKAVARGKVAKSAWLSHVDEQEADGNVSRTEIDDITFIDSDVVGGSSGVISPPTLLACNEAIAIDAKRVLADMKTTAVAAASANQTSSPAVPERAAAGSVAGVDVPFTSKYNSGVGAKAGPHDDGYPANAIAVVETFDGSNAALLPARAPPAGYVNRNAQVHFPYHWHLPATYLSVRQALNQNQAKRAASPSVTSQFFYKDGTGPPHCGATVEDNANHVQKRKASNKITLSPESDSDNSSDDDD